MKKRTDDKIFPRQKIVVLGVVNSQFSSTIRKTFKIDVCDQTVQKILIETLHIAHIKTKQSVFMTSQHKES